jgi:hypothetical protein
MIETTPFDHCECKRMGNSYALCRSELALEERGKKVCLSLRRGEEAKVLVLDGCVFADHLMKCDALYLYKSPSRKVAALVELKGAGDIPHAFAQLAYTKRYRPEDAHLKNQLAQAGPGALVEKSFIVTNGMLPKPEIERLENRHEIRVSAILHSEPSKKMPDLREWL